MQSKSNMLNLILLDVNAITHSVFLVEKIGTTLSNVTYLENGLKNVMMIQKRLTGSQQIQRSVPVVMLPLRRMVVVIIW